MRTALILAAAVIAAAVLLRAFLRTQPAQLAYRVRVAGALALMFVGAVLLYLRQFALGLALAVAGYMILRRSAPLQAAASGQQSNVRSAGLEMRLDHDTGEMDGRVLSWRHDGRMLSELTLAELLEVGADFRGDADSLRLLESYLDRAHPGWRDDLQADRTRRQSAAPGTGRMSTQEAYEILGLQPGASESEVREAHRRLMKQVHPDRGGSAALAAKINEAKERILGHHR
jgi:hypothetical protein